VETVRQVLTARALPMIIGGDHSITGPNVEACAEAHGPIGLLHFDTHTDTGTEVLGATLDLVVGPTGRSRRQL
jgi:arginase family enzyme